MSMQRRWPALLCWLAVVIEGYDLVAFGATIPTLLRSHYLGITPISATVIAALSLVGVGVGAAAVGVIADRFGRRSTMLISILVFSIFTLLVPLMPDLTLMTAARFIAGLGLGACMPLALTLMSEFSSSAHTARSTTRTMTGYHTGAVLTSLLALVFVERWEWLFYVGGAVGLLIVPLMWRYLPESEAFLEVKQTAAGKSMLSSVSSILRKPYLLVTLGVWVASFMGLLLVYGLNTWLPTIMGAAGYSLSSSLLMLLILNFGGIVGLLLAGQVADRKGIKPSTLIWFAAAALFIAILSVKYQQEWLLNVVIFFTGLFVFSAQVLVYALVSKLFPTEMRGTALGMASGVGRVGAIVGPSITGSLVAAGVVYPGGFYVFAVVAVLAVAAIAVVPVAKREGRDAAAVELTSSVDEKLAQP